ncbi:hypothetical protein F5Y10DRAFT_258636 [Nemania abortiva]|nr:hypothetical protein F5Y10DRAFT_258636 [Nemania abortiva]
MNILAEQAAAVFDSSSICEEAIPNSNNNLFVMTIDNETCNKSQIQSGSISKALFKEFITLQLIVVPVNSDDQRLPINKFIFRRLITEHLKIDPCVLYFIAKRYDGFHRIDSATSTSYIIGTSMYMLVWKYDRQRGSTAGLLFERREHGFCKSIPDLLERFSSHSRSPGLLAFVACLATCESLDANIEERDLHHIRHLEAVTAFGPDGVDIPRHRHETEKIMYWLKLIADAHINLSHKLRITSMMSSIIDDILGDYGPSSTLADGGTDMRSAVLVLASRIKSFDTYVVYVKERATQLSNVLFALLTHEDAAISADMAKSSHELARHSTYIAECAKRDSASMKSITIITMTFLPATFFATLFALPTLDWNGETIVTGKFWIYWAFTIPTTALVLLLWVSLTCDGAKLMTAIRSLLGGSTKREE